MARNLYDVGDRHPDVSGAWLNEKEDRQGRIVPIGAVLVALALGAAVLLIMKDALPMGGDGQAKNSPTRISDQFWACDDVRGDACVLSANSYAWRGRAYHLSDISVPREPGAQCPTEADLARRGRASLLAMMNGGAFDARPDPADHDPAARLLIRDGVSLGQLMVLKGYAVAWSPTPVDWCKES
ncbi:hypothetical protein J3E64_000767 [Sphingobium sp. OAS761]|uniref:nuclease n=1 Tax=Sphingobium sp. OAS761 TaxID=2817901 RepID=UPI00209D77C9|nr:nuclease [Sphingobium sp. OAS761]MCP1469096.1 hypothetical protein [Sphingobium sp. OAS761]